MLKTAVQAVEIAGEILKASTPDKVSRWSKNNNQRHIVSEIDYRIESEVRAFLRRVTPEIGILGEEYSPSSQLPQQGLVWVLDPLDGTSNYVHAMNHHSVSLALLENGEPVAAAVYSPGSDDLFTAAEGHGAFLNNTALQVSAEADLREGLICIEWGRTVSSIQIGLAVLQRMAPLVNEVRFLGGAALTLCYVASGTLNAYIDHGLDIWDYAAGRLIVQEAGGTVLKLATLDRDILIAANPRLAHTIAESLSGLTNISRKPS